MLKAICAEESSRVYGKYEDYFYIHGIVRKMQNSAIMNRKSQRASKLQMESGTVGFSFDHEKYVR